MIFAPIGAIRQPDLSDLLGLANRSDRDHTKRQNRGFSGQLERPTIGSSWRRSGRRERTAATKQVGPLEFADLTHQVFNFPLGLPSRQGRCPVISSMTGHPSSVCHV